MSFDDQKRQSCGPSCLGQAAVTQEAHVVQQGVRPRGKLVEKGVHPRVQGRPVAGQAMQAQHVRAQPAPQLLMTPILLHLLSMNTDK